jgi:hypothetical protein
MVQGCQKLRLTLEASQSCGVTGKLLGQNLDGDISLENDVMSPVDDAHSTRPEAFDDLVMTESSTDHDGLPARGNSDSQLWFRTLLHGPEGINGAFARGGTL